MRKVLRSDKGSTVPLEPSRWRARPTPEEEHVLGQVEGPVLDVGCGPGRHVLALARMGVPALGIDISPLAVSIARGRGAEVLQRCVFRPLPLQGAWRTVLLLDGNIGIGGCPTTLLSRIRQLLVPGGRALVEVDPPGDPDREDAGPGRARLGPWAVVPVGPRGGDPASPDRGDRRTRGVCCLGVRRSLVRPARPPSGGWWSSP